MLLFRGITTIGVLSCLSVGQLLKVARVYRIEYNKPDIIDLINKLGSIFPNLFIYRGHIAGKWVVN